LLCHLLSSLANHFAEFQNIINPVCAYFNATLSGAIPVPSCDTKSPVPTGLAVNAVNATPSAYVPLHYEGNTASNLRMLSGGTIIVIGVVAAFLV
jgi:hypothetical protein